MANPKRKKPDHQKIVAKYFLDALCCLDCKKYLTLFEYTHQKEYCEYCEETRELDLAYLTGLKKALADTDDDEFPFDGEAG